MGLHWRGDAVGAAGWSRWAVSHEARDSKEAKRSAQPCADGILTTDCRQDYAFNNWRSAFASMRLRHNDNKQNAGPSRTGEHGRTAMKTLAFAGALMCSLLAATALSPVPAADMTQERALNVGKEPQNWLLHHDNYQGWRFSQLKQINTDTVKNLKLVFTVALGGFESGGRYKFGNLEGTPLVEDGMMYVTDGWGSVYAIDVSSGKKGMIKLEIRSRHRPRLGRRRRLLRRQQSRRGAVEGQGDLDRARRPAVLAQQGDRRDGVGAQGRRSRHRRDDHARATGRSRSRHRRQRRRRVRHPRMDRRHRSQYRQAGLAHLHHSGRGRARQRDLEGRQAALAARRRLGLGDRHL